MTYTATTLSERLNVSKEAATGLLRYLTEAGLATRVSTASTGRRGRQPGVFTIEPTVLSTIANTFSTVATETVPTVNSRPATNGTRVNV